MRIRAQKNLWGALAERGLTQREFAQLAGENRAIVSLVVRGHRNLDKLRQVKWAKILGCRVEDIFPNEERPA
jgi:transcriptional regulator with XRE-family HTH domain